MNEKQALIVVDVQNDFLETGALPVPYASEVIPVINRIIPEFRHIVFTQDWHPKGHISFADNHPGKRPYEAITLNYGEQILWPTHCVQETLGAQLAEKLDILSKKERKRKSIAIQLSLKQTDKLGLFSKIG